MVEPHGRPDGVPSLPSEASVEALRAQLDEIRRSLDETERGIAGTRPGHTPGDGSAAPPRRRRRRTVLVAVLAGIVLIALAVIVLPTVLPVRPGPDGAAAAGSAPATVGSQDPGYRPGVTAVGTDVTVSLGAGEALAVQEQATVAVPQTTLTLRLPDPAAVPDSRLTAPTVADLRATAEGRELVVTRSADGWTVRDPQGRELRRVRLSYTLQGAVIERGVPGRALFVITPLTALASQAEGAPVQVRVADARVRQAACLGAPPADQLCGSLQADGWLARVPATATVPLVVFQIDGAGPTGSSTGSSTGSPT